MIKVETLAPLIQPYPTPDQGREDRLIDEIADLMHNESTAFRAKAQRWIGHTLRDIAGRPIRWWFLQNVASTTLGQGDDVIDLVGHIHKVAAIFSPGRLHKVPLSDIVNRRQQAAKDGSANGGTPQYYALEAGRRVHLWPCPHERITFAVMYSRPLDIAIVPDDWEPIIINGAMGLFGVHYDIDGLADNPDKFEPRYERALKRAKSDSHDVDIIEQYEKEVATTTISAGSSKSAVARMKMPASLTGIGYVSVQCGDYPLQVI